jgi:hypothetical protein
MRARLRLVPIGQSVFGAIVKALALSYILQQLGKVSSAKANNASEACYVEVCFSYISLVSAAALVETCERALYITGGA